MGEVCKVCLKPIKPGQVIFQITDGRYFRGYITPSYIGSFQEEVHEYCFIVRGTFEIVPQTEPYRCVICLEEVEHGSEVVYITRGTKPLPPYRRPEGRGRELYYFAHRTCYVDRDVK